MCPDATQGECVLERLFFDMKRQEEKVILKENNTNIHTHKIYVSKCLT